jgi:citrate lyase subunit beta/citryl-CoA lyase/(S)-citramalyl-CoA lyase
VAASDKEEARAAVLTALPQLDPARVAVRINGLRTDHGLRDLLALRDADVVPAAVFIPMAACAEHVHLVREVLGRPGVGLVPLIETASALRAAHEIAAAPGVMAMMFGGGDLSAELGVELAWEPLAAARAQFVLACGGRGVGLIDVPFVGLDDPEGLAEETRRAKALGFTAKAAIHPAQVAAIRGVFAPTADEVAQARLALERYRAAGGKAVRHGGQMIEAPLIKRYEAMLAGEEARNA